MNIDNYISELVLAIAQQLYGADVTLQHIQIQKTRKEFEGDYTLVTFPLVKLAPSLLRLLQTRLARDLSRPIVRLVAIMLLRAF